MLKHPTLRTYLPVLILIFLCGFRILRYVSSFHLDPLDPDVVEYITLTQNMSHPFDTNWREPVTIWITHLSRVLFGYHDYSLRILGLLFFLGTTLSLYAFIRDALNSSWASWVGAALFGTNGALIHLAGRATRDIPFMFFLLALAYFLYIRKPWLTPKRRVLGLAIFSFLCIGTRMGTLGPALALSCLAFLMHRLPWKLFPVYAVSVLLLLSPYWINCYKEFGDPLISANLHARYLRTFEFVLLKKTGCSKCPTMEQIASEGMYGNPPVTALEYAFLMRPFSEWVRFTTTGFVTVFSSPSGHFDLLLGFHSMIAFGIYLFGLLVSFFSRLRFIALIPISSVFLFLFLIPNTIDTRIYTPPAPFVSFYIALGVLSLSKGLSKVWAKVWVKVRVSKLVKTPA